MSAALKLRELRIAFDGCPLCDGKSVKLRTERCAPRHELPTDLTWMKCGACGHVHTQHYWNEEGCAELFLRLISDQVFGGELDTQRIVWGEVIRRMVPHAGSGRWVDVGTGNGACLFTAVEFGFDAVGIDRRDLAIEPLKRLGYAVEMADAAEYDYAGTGAVVLADILEHMPYPRALLERIRSGLDGALFVSCPNMDSASWRYLDLVGKNTYWQEQEHYHNFTRASLGRLLFECGFEPVDYAVSRRYQGCMEIIARTA